MIVDTSSCCLVSRLLPCLVQQLPAAGVVDTRIAAAAAVAHLMTIASRQQNMRCGRNNTNVCC